MALEIERKFLLRNDTWKVGAEGVAYRQGYLSLDPQRTVRVRIAGDRAFLTIKGATRGCARSEYEYPIPLQQARQMLDELCLRPQIEKTRYRVPHAGLIWEIDEFHGANEGLVLAEVELDRPDQPVVLPDWVGEEVTGDERYYNACLSRTPFSSWPQRRG
ncbi:adenylate cyclase [Geothermobacter hydrogeniphilus]|uniref:Adenylate cyclase n=1 Tax=Geothermobacter hydrogeniphilus TaxID=1969733 RepID=A0A2K2H5H8_9BACT|nr:CYTH domain-containing protein [Geothermobacter hydrogeniphilus]PNU18585.1 adenylate cyclase [Geothermobacter hydrogeniphilus]